MEESNVHIRDDVKTQFESTKKLLLPNEAIAFACEEEDGFVILTDRRLIRSWHKHQSEGFRQVVPIDCIHSLQETKKDHWEFYGIEVEDDGVLKGKEKKGQIQYETKKEKIRPPSLSKSEKDQKDDIYRKWDETLRNLSTTIDNMKTKIQSYGSQPPKRDYAYLEAFPDSIKDSPHFERLLLEKNVLDEARNILGETPIVFNNTVSQYGMDMVIGADSRSESGKEEYEGFAIGEKGIVFVEYAKRELSGQEYRDAQTYGSSTGPKTTENYHLFSYNKLQGITSKWWETRIRLNYPKEKKGEVEYHKKTQIPKIKRENFTWDPPKSVEKFDYPWFTEPLNFSWIIADAVYAKCDMPVTASTLDLDKSFKKKDTSTFQPRYMY